MLFLQLAASGLGIQAGNQDGSEGLGFILKSSSRVGLIHQTKLRREAEKGASECEAPQPQGDISPSGKKHLWGGSGGSALAGGPHPNARGCMHSVGTFSSARASAERGMYWWWQGLGLGLCGRPLPGAWDSTGGSSWGLPARHRCPQHLPGTDPGAAGPGALLPHTVRDPLGGPAAPLAVMSQSSSMMSQAVAMEIA